MSRYCPRGHGYFRRMPLTSQHHSHHGPVRGLLAQRQMALHRPEQPVESVGACPAASPKVRSRQTTIPVPGDPDGRQDECGMCVI